jgi:hypothetical protein
VVRTFLTRKVIMILIDGFSSKYVSKQLSANLYSLKEADCLAKLTPMFGFQGVGAAMYSGAPSNITGIFTEFVLRQNEPVSQSHFLQMLLRISDNLPRDSLCLNTRALLFKLIRFRNAGVSNLIPPEILDRFSPKIQKKFTSYGSLGKIKTVFDIMQENGMSFDLLKPLPLSETNSFNNIIGKIKRGTLPDLMVIHPCSLDILGHDFGPNSKQIEHAITIMDNHIGHIVKSTEFLKDEIMIIILSDHGMVPVKKYFDLKYVLNEIPLKLGKDYLVFMDSTMARFWFFNNRARELIAEKLSPIKFGRILDKKDRTALGIEKIGDEYGELIYAVNDGVVIFPDFFRKWSPPKGMHGYSFQTYDTPIFALYCNKKKLTIQGSPRFIDITPTILDYFELQNPKSCEGFSLWK